MKHAKGERRYDDEDEDYYTTVSDLLEALRDIVDWTHAIDGSLDTLEEIRSQCQEIAQQAISKATEKEGQHNE